MAEKKPNRKQTEQPSFEQSLERLEQIVHLLEEGEIGLDEGLARYEEGVKLLRQAYDLLERAERRIELLSGVDPEGNPISQALRDEATLADDGAGEPGGRSAASEDA